MLSLRPRPAFTRPLVALLLTLTLMLGSVTQAVARSEMVGTTLFALCNAEQSSILLDPMGQPVQARHACPHCLAASVVGLSPDAPLLQRPGKIAATPFSAQTVPLPPAALPTPSARGPPRRI